jgi:N-acetylglucosamine-6-sulfatase
VSGGCYSQHWIDKVEPHTFPKLLQQNGYQTFYTGKYLNQYKGETIPPGWSTWFGLLGNSKYRDYSLNENGKIVHYDDGTYLTDLMVL